MVRNPSAGDLADHEADLIHVGGEHDAWHAIGLVADAGDEGANAVGLNLVGEGSEFASDDGADGALMAGGAEGVGELFEEGGAGGRGLSGQSSWFQNLSSRYWPGCMVLVAVMISSI